MPQIEYKTLGYIPCGIDKYFEISDSVDADPRAFELVPERMDTYELWICFEIVSTLSNHAVPLYLYVNLQIKYHDTSENMN